MPKIYNNGSSMVAHRVPVIGIYAPDIYHLVETFGYQLTWEKTVRVVFVTDLENMRGEHPWCLKRLRQFSEIDILDLSAPALPTEQLYVVLQSHRRMWSRNLNRWVLATSKVAALTPESYSQGWRAAAREWIRCLPYTLLIRSIGFEIAKSSRNPYFHVPHRFFLTPTPHPQFIVDQELRALMYGPPTCVERTFRFHFVGSRTPHEREVVLRKVEAQLTTGGYSFTADPSSPADVLWIEYGETDSKRGVPPREFVGTLDRSVFSICPFGWGDCWTHRVIEALLRGVIPIVPDEKRYNIGLKDGVNCIAVRKADWDCAIRRASEMPLSEIQLLQEGIAELRPRLLVENAARQLRQSAGLEC